VSKTSVLPTGSFSHHFHCRLDVAKMYQLATFDDSNHSRLGLAIVPLCRGTGAPLRRIQAPPGPFDFFDK